MTLPLRLVVFDMDGTLIDSQDVIVTAMQEAFSRKGLPHCTRAQILSIVGLSLDQAVATLVPSLSDRDRQEIVTNYREIFVDLRVRHGAEANSPLYPGVRETLDLLAQDDFLLMGVATGKARRGLDHAYESHDIGRYFVTHQTADGHPSKPHPSMLLSALAETGVEARHAVMVGDTAFDMEMGKAAGYHTIGVDWGYHSRDRLGEADHILSSMSDLPAYLQAHWESVT